MNSKDVLTQSLAVIAVVCAVTVTGIAVRNQFRQADKLPGSMTPPQIKDWQKYAASGHRMGPPNAQVTILEFADFECPICGRFTNGALRAIRAQYPGQVAVVFRNWPLRYHKMAYPTARAAECADAQGRFEAFHDLIYAKQDSLGKKSLGEFAHEAGVPNPMAFDRCISVTDSVPRINADIAAARGLGGRGTPIVIVNGLMLGGAPDSASLDGYVRRALKG